MTNPYLVTDVVREFGADATGTFDTTAQVQAAIDAAPDGTAIYFPQGTYIVGDLKLGEGVLPEGVLPEAAIEAGGGGFGDLIGVDVLEGRLLAQPRPRRRGLLFFGDGHQSILIRLPTAERIATIRNCTDITFRSLAFDANGLGGLAFGRRPNLVFHEGGGGLYFDLCQDIRIYDTYAMDGAFVHPDRVSLSFVAGANFVPVSEEQFADRTGLLVTNSRNVWVVGNLFEKQQMSFAGCSSVTISGNTLVDPVFRAIKVGGLESPISRLVLGLAAQGLPIATESGEIVDGIVDQDYEITNNIIANAWTHGIYCGSGPYEAGLTPKVNSLRRIHIAGNVINKDPAMTIGVEPNDNEERRSRAYGCGILVGTAIPAAWTQAEENIEDLVVEGNTIVFAGLQMNRFSHGILIAPFVPGLPLEPEQQDEERRSLSFGTISNPTPTSTFPFVVKSRDPGLPGDFEPFAAKRVIVRDNTVQGVDARRFPNIGIDAAGLVLSTIGGNGVYGGRVGIHVHSPLQGNHVYQNRVQVSDIGYHIAEFLLADGRNVYGWNAVLGDVGTTYVFFPENLFGPWGPLRGDIMRHL